MAARLALAFAALCLLCAAPAQAQAYQRLHVRSFTLSSDTAHPQLERPFHVTLSIRVDESGFNGDNVFLPSFEGAEELGDEQQIERGTRGTLYRETLTLVAHARGTLTISRAYLDAIDARDGKPKRFLSNSLSLRVGGGPITGGLQRLRIAVLAGIGAIAGCAVALFGALLWRRRAVRVPAVVAGVPPAQSDPVQVPDVLQEAWSALRARRDRASVLHLRTVLWRRTGARPGETLGDVLRRAGTGETDLRRLLLVVERAAFVERERLDEAIEEVLCSPR